MSSDGVFVTYCAICACPFYDVLVEEQYDWCYDRSQFANMEAAEWLGDMRCVCRHSGKCFISGPGLDAAKGDVSVAPGDDPDFPPLKESESYFYAYHANLKEDPCFPFHPVCYRLLTQVLAYESSGTVTELDKNVVYQVFSALNTLKDSQALGINYFELDESKTVECFNSERGGESWVMHPLELPELIDFCTNLPKALSTTSPPPVPPAPHVSSTDAFSKLPGEVVNRMMSLLSLSDIISLRLASRRIASTPLSNPFWRTLVLRDMPWLRDALPQLQSGADNKELYKSMKEASKGSRPSFIRGLANRRRIWNISLQIIQCYLPSLRTSEGSRQED